MKLLVSLINVIAVRWMVFLMRCGWYRFRKQKGHPISLRRALLGKYPRFSSYEYDEVGCPDWAKKDYELVGDK